MPIKKQNLLVTTNDNLDDNIVTKNNFMTKIKKNKKVIIEMTLKAIICAITMGIYGITGIGTMPSLLMISSSLGINTIFSFFQKKIIKKQLKNYFYKISQELDEIYEKKFAALKVKEQELIIKDLTLQLKEQELIGKDLTLQLKEETLITKSLELQAKIDKNKKIKVKVNDNFNQGILKQINNKTIDDCQLNLYLPKGSAITTYV